MRSPLEPILNAARRMGVGQAARQVLQKAGFGIYSLNAFWQNSFGHDWLRDIQHLSTVWGNPIRVVFDVGANDGGTVNSVREAFASARVFAFEPHPTTFARLQQKMADAEHVSLHQFALGSEKAEADMFVYEASELNSLLPDSNFVQRFPLEADLIKVKVTTLDAFCVEQGIQVIDVLKIDTEGFDLQVLKGSTETLRKGGIRFIYVEFNDIISPNESGALAPIAALLRSFGFRFIASYNDRIVLEGELFAVSNALFALPRHAP